MLLKRRSGGKPPFLTTNLLRNERDFERAGASRPSLPLICVGALSYSSSGGKPPFLTTNLRRSFVAFKQRGQAALPDHYSSSQ